ncbi:MAG: alpha/beta hydrolase [Hellea sp.]|nr:alpha/beta hydrolase [Hellea sp.]
MPSLIHKFILAVYRTGLVPNPMKMALENGRVIRQHPKEKQQKKYKIATDKFQDFRVHSYGVPKDGEPILYFCHGGGFLIGMIEPYFDMIGNLQKELEFPAIAPDYPMPTETDAIGMQAWIKAHFKATQAAFPNSKFIIAGDSAGAHMALRLAQQLSEEDRDPAIANIVGLYIMFGWLDLSRTESDYPHNKEEVLLEACVIGGAIDRFRGDIASNDARISPLFGSLNDLPPVRIVSGGKDMLYEESIALEKRLNEIGESLIHKKFSAYAHDFIMFPSSDARKGIRDIAEMMRADVAS